MMMMIIMQKKIIFRRASNGQITQVNVKKDIAKQKPFGPRFKIQFWELRQFMSVSNNISM